MCSHDGAVHEPYSCSHCGKSFPRRDHLNSHVRRVHSTDRPFGCEHCEAAFATKFKDRVRVRTVQHEDKAPGHVCGKMLSSAYILDHMKVRSQGPHHVRELCNKGFTTAAYGLTSSCASCAACTARPCPAGRPHADPWGGRRPCPGDASPATAHQLRGTPAPTRYR